MVSKRNSAMHSKSKALKYLSAVNCPEVCFAVHNLAQFVSNPGEPHWCALNDSNSTWDFCFILSRFDSVASWASKMQGCVALSSCEAEYVSLALAAQEAVYLHGVLTLFCLMTVDTPVLLCGDNQGALALASNTVAHERAKHIETRHHFICQLVEDKRFNCLMSPQRSTWLIFSSRTYPSLPSMSSHRNSLSFSHLSHQLNPCLPHNSIVLLYPIKCFCYN